MEKKEITLITDKSKSRGGANIAAARVGGNNEIIKHKFNGYLAKTYDTTDFANGINFCLNSINHNKLLITNKKIRKMFDPKLVLKRYSNIINTMSQQYEN